MRNIEFYEPKSSIITVYVLFLLLLADIGMVLFYDMRLTLGVFLACAIVPLIILNISNLQQKGPEIIISEAGVFYKPVGKVIPWERIESMEVRTLGRGQFATIRVKSIDGKKHLGKRDVNINTGGIGSYELNKIMNAIAAVKPEERQAKINGILDRTDISMREIYHLM